MGAREHPDVEKAVKHYERENMKKKYSIAAAAKKFGFDRSTLSRALKRRKPPC